MEKLIKRLQQEAELTEEQAVKTIAILKSFMDNEGLNMDWDKFFKGKYDEFVEKARNLFEVVSTHTHNYADKVVHKVDDLAAKAKKGVPNFSQKTLDEFDEKYY